MHNTVQPPYQGINAAANETFLQRCWRSETGTIQAVAAEAQTRLIWHWMAQKHWHRMDTFIYLVFHMYIVQCSAVFIACNYPTDLLLTIPLITDVTCSFSWI